MKIKLDLSIAYNGNHLLYYYIFKYTNLLYIYIGLGILYYIIKKKKQFGLK